MIDVFTIFLQNQTSEPQHFWCFLAPPVEVESTGSIFSTSGLNVIIDSNSSSEHFFAIPAPFVVGAGASDEPVGRDAGIVSSLIQNTAPGDSWQIDYGDPATKAAPSMTLTNSDAKGSKITVVTRAFDEAASQAAGWFNQQSFGLRTSGAFLGSVWPAAPSTVTDLTPAHVFYITVGSFGENVLVPWTGAPSSMAQLTEADFSSAEVTVTLTEAGDWSTRPGRPDGTTPS